MRLIDADDLLEKVQTNFENCDNEAQRILNGFLNLIIKDLVNKQPTIEAELVRHGKWESYADDYFVCSVCKTEWTMEEGTPESYGWIRCPICGAKMDGGGTE